MSAERLRCKACGHMNDITAFACGACGETLVGTGAERWLSARDRDVVEASDAEVARAQSARGARIALGAVAIVVLGVVGWFAASWYTRNYYVLSAPVYDSQLPEYWAGMLKSDDHYLRRRAALALDKICARFNERTAREIVPALREALSDPDEDVRKSARSALDKIRMTTGVT